MNPYTTRFIKRVLDTFIDLNCPVDSEYVDPDTMNLKSELYIDLLKNIYLWIDTEDLSHQHLMQRMCLFVEESQNFDANSEVIRPLMSHEDMSVVSLRILTYCLVGICKDGYDESVDDSESVDDDTEPPLETDYPYVEGEDFIDIVKFQKARDDNEE